MGCCNEPVSTLTNAPPDPTQHVNYARGMVLGVDDFTQEFAYLNGRDRWTARDVLGYGTLSGLHVFAEDDGSDGMRLHVTAGSALVPSGQLVCVPADQCCVINRWLAKPDNAAIVNGLLNPGSPPLSPPVPLSPPALASGPIALYLVLCYADCQTRPVPIPGEPCRSDDSLMAPSRIADDFRIELRAAAPVQTEEDAVRDFVRWLRANVSVSDASPPLPPADDATWLHSLRTAVQPWLDAQAASPPLSPPATVSSLGDYLFDISPPIAIEQADLCAFLRVALRFWVTELRPLWMARRCATPLFGDSDCVLLAQVGFEVTWIGGSPSGAWQITGSPVAVSIDERQRPVLGHLRLLQEWQLCGCECGAGGDAVAAAVSAPAPAPAPLLATAAPAEPIAPVTAPAPSAGPATLPLVVADGDLVLDDTRSIVIARGQPALRLTLPAANRTRRGRVLTIKNTDVGELTVLPSPRTHDHVEGGASLALHASQGVTLVADGAGAWWVVGRTQ